MTAQANANDSGLVLNLTRQLKASRTAVFRAFTEPEALAAWFGPETVTAKNVQVDLRVGGRYSLEMHNAEGLVTTLSGVYQEITPPERLVMTWLWGMGDLAGIETRVTIMLSETETGCELQLVHEGLPGQDWVEKHNGGWTSSFVCLDRLLAEG